MIVYTNNTCRNISNTLAVIKSCKEIASSVSVSPNPSQGIVTVNYAATNTGKVEINIIDKTGRVLFTKTEKTVKGNNSYQLNLSNLINGMYNLQINNGGEEVETKIIIEK